MKVRNRMLEIIKRKKKMVYSILASVILMIWIQREIFFSNKGFGFRMLELIFTMCMVVAFTWIIYYLIIEKTDLISKRTCLFYYFKLFFIQTCAFLPLYTQNFMYGDDFWAFAVDFNGELGQGLYFSRPFLDFVYGIVRDTSFLSIRYFRISNGIILFIFGCILFRYLVLRKVNSTIAFFFAVIAIAGCSAVDCIAYASIFPISWSLMLSAISFVIYLKARNARRFKIILLIESGVCLFSAFCFYQIGTPVVFLMYIIAEKTKENNEERKRAKLLRAMSYLLYYGITVIAYLAITKILQLMTGVVGGQQARSEIILSINQFIEKMNWFMEDVCPQSFTRLTGVLFGNSLFIENNMFYHCTYLNNGLGIFFNSIFVILMVISIINTAWKQRNFWYIVISIMAVPLSFWPFLILPESAFITYYALGIIYLFLWYVLDGIMVVVDTIENRLGGGKLSNISGDVLTGILIMIVLLKSNAYAENAWVNYNRDAYEYLANNIVSELMGSKNDVDTIIIKESIGPLLDDYVIACIRDVLVEMGYNADDYQIINSADSYALSEFTDGEVVTMKNVIGEKVADEVLAYYIHDDMYGRWLMAKGAQSDSEKEFLKECFIKTGLMAEENERAIFISLEGFNIRNKF
jgi:hypothetical protein